MEDELCPQHPRLTETCGVAGEAWGGGEWQNAISVSLPRPLRALPSALGHPRHQRDAKARHTKVR